MPASSGDSSVVDFFLAVLKHSGAGAVVAIVFGFAVNRIYDDLGERNTVLIELLREQSRASVAVSEALINFSLRLDRLHEDVRGLAPRQ